MACRYSVVSASAKPAMAGRGTTYQVACQRQAVRDGGLRPLRRCRHSRIDRVPANLTDSPGLHSSVYVLGGSWGLAQRLHTAWDTAFATIAPSSGTNMSKLLRIVGAVALFAWTAGGLAAWIGTKDHVQVTLAEGQNDPGALAPDHRRRVSRDQVDDAESEGESYSSGEGKLVGSRVKNLEKIAYITTLS